MAHAIFGTVLEPEANAAHKNHFHLYLEKRRYPSYLPVARFKMGNGVDHIESAGQSLPVAVAMHVDKSACDNCTATLREGLRKQNLNVVGRSESATAWQVNGRKSELKAQYRRHWRKFGSTVRLRSAPIFLGPSVMLMQFLKYLLEIKL